MPQAVRRKKNESQKPAPKKKQTQASQTTVTAGGGPQEEVNPRQLLMQSQHNPMGRETQKTKPKLHNSTPSPRGYAGRNDGQVQQSTAGKPGGLSSGGNYSITSGHWDPASASQKDKGKVKGLATGYRTGCEVDAIAWQSDNKGEALEHLVGKSGRPLEPADVARWARSGPDDERPDRP